jgi:hypothetical protein
MRHRATPRLVSTCVLCLCGLAAGAAAYAGPAQLSFSSGVTYPTVIQGATDPVYGYVYNDAAPGSASLNYSVAYSFPYVPPVTLTPTTGTRVADGGAGYDTLEFDLNSALVVPGTVPYSLTATNTTSGGYVTQSGTITVLTHASPIFYIGGNAVPLSPVKINPPDLTVPPSVSTEQASATGGNSFAAAAPAMLGDPLPDEPADEMDLDSITAIGDPQISITLGDFTDLPPDDPSAAPSDMIDVDGSVDGTFFTQFELNYSDEQDLPGADAPGSEHAYFGVQADVSGSGPDESVELYVETPEPASIGLIALAGAATLTRRRRAAAGA